MYQRIGPPAYKEGLERIRHLCQFLDQPQDRMGFIIHVAGTNGKGSTTQIITKLLMAHGLQVGTYTSPHLEALTERITRDGEQIDQHLFHPRPVGPDITGVPKLRKGHRDAALLRLPLISQMDRSAPITPLPSVSDRQTPLMPSARCVAGSPGAVCGHGPGFPVAGGLRSELRPDVRR